MTMTDLHQFHLKRSLRPGVKYIYAFHALVSTHMMYRAVSFDHYDCILCTGPYHLAEIKKREQDLGLPPKDLRKAGYYRLERIYHAHLARTDDTKNRPTILLAPSWGTKNLLNSGGREITGLLLESGYNVVFRPHPELVKRESALIDELADAFSANPCFEMELSTAGDESILRADVLIADWSGIALEYAFGTERPVLFFDLPRKVKNADYAALKMPMFEVEVREQIGKVVADLESVLQGVRELLDQPQPYADRIRTLRAENVFHFGESSKIGADIVMEYLDQSQKASPSL